MKSIEIKGILMFIVFALFFGNNSFAATPEQSDDTIIMKKSDLPPELVKRFEAAKKVEEFGKYAEYVGMGKAFGTAVNESLTAITSATAEFGRTDVGHFTMFLIAYKVFGRDLVKFTVGILGLIVSTSIFIWSYAKNCITRSVPKLKNVEGNVEYEILEGEKEEKWGHVIVYAVFVVGMFVVMFAV